MVKKVHATVIKFNGVFNSENVENKIIWELKGVNNELFFILNAQEYNKRILPKLNIIEKIFYGKWCVRKNHLDSLDVNDNVEITYISIDNINYVIKIQ